MDYLHMAKQHFRSRGLDITAKACQSLAVAVGLAGSTSECDEAFVALGLRGTNSILSLLTDRYNLNFETIDDEVAAYSAAKEYDVIREELRRLGYPANGHIFGSQEDEYESWYQIMDIFVPSKHGSIYVGAEGEPDVETLDAVQSTTSSPVFALAADICRSENRGMLETFDLLQATAELPLTSQVFAAGHLSSGIIRKELARYRTLEPYIDRQQILLTFDAGRICVRPFALLDGYKYEEQSLPPERLVVQMATPLPFVAQSTLTEFEDLINWQNVSETDIQRFLEKHPELLLGDLYRTLHSQLILDRGDKGALIPDFFAELTHGRHFDLIDLKKPNEKLIVGTKNRRGFSAAVNTAIGQLREYRDYFDDSRQRKKFYETYGLRGWKPRIAVVIGRNPQCQEYETFIRARRTVFDAEIVTYDDIIERAKRRLITVTSVLPNRRKP